MEDSNKKLSVAYGNMAGLFVEAIKELRCEMYSEIQKPREELILNHNV